MGYHRAGRTVTLSFDDHIGCPKKHNGQLKDSHANNRPFLTSLRSMLAMAEAQEAPVSEGMTPTLLEELGRMLEAVKVQTGSTAGGS